MIYAKISTTKFKKRRKKNQDKLPIQQRKKERGDKQTNRQIGRETIRHRDKQKQKRGMRQEKERNLTQEKDILKEIFPLTKTRKFYKNSFCVGKFSISVHIID